MPLKTTHPLTQAQAILQTPHDSLLEAMGCNIEALASRAAAYKARSPAIEDTLKAFDILGHVSIDGANTIDIRVSGDKDTFLKCWKLWRELGYRLRPATAGATELGEYITINGIRFWFYFSSTVCQRVQVGTKMQEVPIFETRCDSGQTLDVPSLEAPTNLSTPLSETDNEIPF